MNTLERILLIILFGIAMLMLGTRLTAIEEAIKSKSYIIPVLDERNKEWDI